MGRRVARGMRKVACVASVSKIFGFDRAGNETRAKKWKRREGEEKEGNGLKRQMYKACIDRSRLLRFHAVYAFQNTKQKYFGFTHASSKVHFRSTEGQTFYWSIMTADDSIKCRCANLGITGQVAVFKIPGFVCKPRGGELPWKSLMGTWGQPGYVFRDFCLKQGIFLNSFVIANGFDKKEFRYLLLSYTGRLRLNVLNRVSKIGILS